MKLPWFSKSEQALAVPGGSPPSFTSSLLCFSLFLFPSSLPLSEAPKVTRTEYTVRVGMKPFQVITHPLQAPIKVLENLKAVNLALIRTPAAHHQVCH